jgi:hypothetical protein
MKCNKPYTVTSSNPKMSGSTKPMKSYMGGGIVKSYQKGGMITMPRKTAKQSMMENMMEDPRNPGAAMRQARRDIESAPKYTAKERAAMQEVEDAKKTRETQEAYKRFYGKK